MSGAVARKHIGENTPNGPSRHKSKIYQGGKLLGIGDAGDHEKYGNTGLLRRHYADTTQVGTAGQQ